MAADAVVKVSDEQFTVPPEHPFVFGRADAQGVVGLDANDMGISAEAGSVECDRNLWWVVNRSRKRPLLLDDGVGGALQRLECGHRHAINTARLVVLVPGVIYTHRLEVAAPIEALACSQNLACSQDDPSSSDTITGDVRLNEHDRDVVVALLSGYLEDFPRRQARPRTYQEAADLLGPPWTKTTVRKRVERLRDRLAGNGLCLEGPQANYDLADYLIGNGVITPTDRNRLAARP